MGHRKGGTAGGVPDFGGRGVTLPAGPPSREVRREPASVGSGWERAWPSSQRAAPSREVPDPSLRALEAAGNGHDPPSQRTAPSREVRREPASVGSGWERAWPSSQRAAPSREVPDPSLRALEAAGNGHDPPSQRTAPSREVRPEPASVGSGWERARPREPPEPVQCVCSAWRNGTGMMRSWRLNGTPTCFR